MRVSPPLFNGFSFAIVFIAACAHSASLAWPFANIFRQGFPIWWLQVTALAALVWAVRVCANARQATLVGWLFATVWLSSTFWWLYVAMHTYAGLHLSLIHI